MFKGIKEWLLPLLDILWISLALGIQGGGPKLFGLRHIIVTSRVTLIYQINSTHWISYSSRINKSTMGK